ncbi:MAG TPA: glycosyl transferase [Advenella kashmirensis]|uniref:Glycosyl transferase n=1 Tax=Advenella kashmirensis TaxID=310575 RepID=A0A356LEU1_9BURK|nr:glycosyl transferase [Advenella kashmirensis]
MSLVQADNSVETTLVSIIIPMHNAATVLPRTLDSVQQQTFRSFEVIMIDDCSTDNTREVAQRYQRDERFHLVQLPGNVGVAGARNEGIARASGSYICFLDADDWWDERKLEIQTTWMENNQCDLSYMDYIRIEDGSGRSLSRVTPPATVNFKTLLKSNFIGNLTAMIHRRAIGDIRFNKAGHEDYIFWLSVLRRGITAYRVPTQQPLCFYLVRPGSLSSNKFRAVKWQWQIYRCTLGISLMPSLWYLAWYLVNALKKRS